MVFALAVLLLAMALAGLVYGVMATLALARFVARVPAAPGDAPAVTILRPMHGSEPQMDETLASLCAQDYAGPVRIVLGAADADDPALAAARRLQADRPDCDVVVVCDATPHGTNRKLGNLINMSAHLTGEIVMISDSDVRLPPEAVAAFVGALQQPGVGLVYGLYRGRPAGGGWSRLAALDVNARFAMSVVVGQALGAHPVLGPTMALRAEVLERTGGFERLQDVLADDFELGRRVRGLGLSIACPPILIDHLFPEHSLAEVWSHELRWTRTIRLLNPGGYAGSIVTHVLPLALLGALLTGFAPLPLALLIGLVVLRAVQVLIAGRLMRADLRGAWLFMLRDLLSFAVFLAAFFGDRIQWRGHRLRVQPDGAMAPS
jgi:ceramide glucosyltransferase